MQWASFSNQQVLRKAKSPPAKTGFIYPYNPPSNRSIIVEVQLALVMMTTYGQPLEGMARATQR